MTTERKPDNVIHLHPGETDATRHHSTRTLEVLVGLREYCGIEDAFALEVHGVGTEALASRAQRLARARKRR